MIDGVICTNCSLVYPEMGVVYRCPVCGGIYDYSGLFLFDPALVDRGLPGIWRYRHTFGLPEEAPVVSLGEGNTPLILDRVSGRQVAFKLEYLNPTGSFKDRGSAAIAGFLRARGAGVVVEDSSGNAGASLAAYAARAGVRARVFVPESASGPKRAQIEAYGAALVSIPGPRSNAAEAARQAAEDGAAYASHAYLPFNLPGYATLAYELVEQLGTVPGTVITPVGQGGLLLGMFRGFEALKEAGISARMPAMIGVQARACAPLWALDTYGPSGLMWAAEGHTLAEGIRVLQPVRGDAVIRAIEASQGRILAVDEPEILPGRDELARRGLYVEPTSAVVWPALNSLPGDTPSPVVAILTGSGFKYSE